MLADGEIPSCRTVLVPHVLHDLAGKRRLEPGRRRRLVVGHVVIVVVVLTVEKFRIEAAACRVQVVVEAEASGWAGLGPEVGGHRLQPCQDFELAITLETTLQKMFFNNKKSILYTLFNA